MLDLFFLFYRGDAADPGFGEHLRSFTIPKMQQNFFVRPDGREGFGLVFERMSAILGLL